MLAWLALNKFFCSVSINHIKIYLQFKENNFWVLLSNEIKMLTMKKIELVDLIITRRII